MIIGSFIVFVIFLLLFLSVLYFDRRNLFLGIFFIATGLSFIFYVMSYKKKPRRFAIKKKAPKPVKEKTPPPEEETEDEEGEE